jgi:ABC-type transporter Mla subunit MlaD
MALVLAAVITAAVLGARGGDDAGTGYRVDVVFDTAKGLLPGQLVKVAGARSGEILDVRLTPDFKARVQLHVDEEAAPFTRDARCTIQPEGLIGESFVQCDPGRRTAPELRGAPPTVPVARTTVPVSFPELFDLATVPVRQRLTVVVGELGLALAGRGEELNDVVRRANPTLGLVEELGRLLDGQRAQLGEAVTTTDAVVAELARSRDRAAALVTSSARVTERMAERRGALRAALRRLPGLLRGTRTTAARLDELVTSGTPLLRDLGTAAPGLRRVVGETGPFARAALPAVRDAGAISVAGRRTLRGATPTLRRVRRFADTARPATTGLATLLTDARDRGVVEMLLQGFANNAVATARYDETSHLLPLRAVSNRCSQIATQPVAGCDTRYGDDPEPVARTRRRAERRSRPAPARSAPQPAAPAPAAPRPPGAAPAPEGGGSALDPVGRLLDGLLRPGGPVEAPAPPPDEALGGLLEYLLR